MATTSPLPTAVDAEAVDLAAGDAGRLHVYRAGPRSGVPLLLVHSVKPRDRCSK